MRKEGTPGKSISLLPVVNMVYMEESGLILKSPANK